ncbi:hypothetical protein DYB35_004214 [Aphanomyces astaci]|uniref:RRM domain-containing protein n=1 Tax=Aphanomyces astaci TaxID=112090 RepID=A0A3R6WSS4_APHAT|nr:hypothetical protein DYB35_004214 [Aphanomyces astaci]
MVMRSVLFMPYCLAVAAATLRIDGWFNCSANTFPSWNARHNTMQVVVECALVELPLCHATTAASCRSDRVIQVFVKRLLGNGVNVDKDVWVLQGGPGASSVASMCLLSYRSRLTHNCNHVVEYMMLDLFTTTNGTANIYTMDHRGTGRSHPLECVAAQASTPGSVNGEAIDIDELPACIRDVFYGTYLVERVMQLGPSHIRGYVLDGVVAQVNHSFAQFDNDINAAGTRFLDRCAKNAFCNSKFPDVVTGNLPLSNLIMHIYTRLDARRPGGVAESLCYPLANWTDTPPSHTLRRFLTTLLMNVNLRGMIPAIVYRLHRCTRQDDHVLAFLQRKIANPSQGRKGFTQLVLPTLRSPTVEGDALVEMNAMLYNLIVFSEEWTYPTPSVADLQLSFESQPFGLGVFDLVPAYCVATNFRDEACRSLRPLSKATPAPYVYARDSFFNHSSTIPPHASVLFLSGTTKGSSSKMTMDDFLYMLGMLQVVIIGPMVLFFVVNLVRDPAFLDVVKGLWTTVRYILTDQSTRSLAHSRSLGYERSVSPDLQQLATKVLWIEDIFHGDDVAVVEGDESPPLSQLPTVPRALLVDSASDKAAASSVVTDQIPVKTPPAHPLSVFVNNLPFDTEKAEIESHFQPHGEVKSVRMPMDPQMGKCRGFAFVQFDSIEGVESALTSSGQDFRGRKLRVRRPFEHRGLPAADVPATTSTSKPTKTSKRKKNQDAADDGKPKRNKTDTTPRPADAVSTMWQLSLQRTLNCIVYSWLMCLGNVAKHAKYVPTVIDLCDDEEGHKELNSDKSD